MLNSNKTAGLRLSQMKEKPKKLLKVLRWCFKLVKLLTLLFNGIDKLWDTLLNMLS